MAGKKTTSPEKWCWCRCLDFIIQANRLLLTVYKRHSIHTCIISRDVRTQHTLSSSSSPSQSLPSLLFVFCVCVSPTKANRRIFNQRATFTIQIIFLNVFELFSFFFISPQKPFCYWNGWWYYVLFVIGSHDTLSLFRWCCCRCRCCCCQCCAGLIRSQA